VYLATVTGKYENFGIISTYGTKTSPEVRS